MLYSTLTLAVGMVLLAAARLSDNPGAYGVVVLAGIVLVAGACAIHLTAITGELQLPAVLQVLIAVAVWLGVSLGTVWVLSRAPGSEVVMALMVSPTTVGVIGLLVSRRHRWSAVQFLVLALLLSALLAPVLVR